jgi:hypothetical protein
MGKKRRWYLHLFFFPIDRFPRQQHVTPLKLRHVAAILFKKKKFNFEIPQFWMEVPTPSLRPDWCTTVVQLLCTFVETSGETHGSGCHTT